ncbi:hypothetical protein GCM10022378_05190 [Salinicoccus jeotgali]|uniref:Cell-wall binding lipoprotein n=1 Tax=Salinicoccus jeotgali TaxID=381634 RepID=A0ABP7EJ77_9STAP
MKKLLGGAMVMAMVLAGCSSASDELLDFYNAFQETVEVEKEIEDVNAKFEELESEKAELQGSLENATKGELGEISDSLVENTEERIKQLDQEVSIMGDSRSRMEASTQYVEEISDESNRKQAQSLIDAMDERYMSHGEMIGSYKSVLNSEKDIFAYLGEEEVSQDEVDERLNSLSKEYEEVQENAEAFSKRTEKVNALKKEIETIIEGE